MANNGRETILQFGAGRFLRAFVDTFVQQANAEGQDVGKIVVVQSTAGARADSLAARGFRYNVAIRGLVDDKTIDQVACIESISRTLSANNAWCEVLEVASSPELRLIVSNTTEAGLNLAENDGPNDSPPSSYPAKITQVLLRRFERNLPVIPVIPCELIEGNGDLLRKLVIEQATRWNLPKAFTDWVRDEQIFINNLVDRIVVGPHPSHPLFDQDPLLLTTEPYALWALERPKGKTFSLFQHPNIELVEDLAPYYLRKVRILNGIHSALVGYWMPKGFTIVQKALADPKVLDWVLGLLYEEIVPAIAYRVPDIAHFARQTIDRLRNPFMEHKLSDIAVKHAFKRKIRLQTTLDEYKSLFGKAPKRLPETLLFDPPVGE